MRSKTDVTGEIRKIVSERIEQGVLIRAEWLTTEILAMKSHIEGDDADFYVACAIDFIKDTAKRCIGLYAPKPAVLTDAQIIMPGFEHVQRAYTVEREGEVVLVPVQLLTDAEIQGRASELMAMARGCVAHAKELRGYLRNREQAA